MMRARSLVWCVCLELVCSVGLYGQTNTRTLPRSDSASRSLPASRNINEVDESRVYLNVLSKLKTLNAIDSTENNKDDWFVVGGMIPKRSVGVQVKFNKFQGEENVAQRVADFVALNNNNCRYHIFSRANSEDEAEKILKELISDRRKNVFEQRRRQTAASLAAVNRQRSLAASRSGFGGRVYSGRVRRGGSSGGRSGRGCG